MNSGNIEVYRKESWNELSKMHFVILGIVSLLSYNFFLQCLGSFVRVFGDRYAAHSHIFYGLSATIGQLFCISSHLIVRPMLLVRTSLFGVSALSFGLVVVYFVEHIHSIICGLSAAAAMGLFISILQSSSAALAAESNSSDLLNSFFFGQSLSGVFPWPITSSLFPVFSRISPSNSDELITTTSMIIGGLATLSCAIYFTRQIATIPHPNQSLQKQSISALSSFVSEWPIIVLCWFTFVVSFSVYPRDLLKWSPRHTINVDLYRSTLVYVAILSDIAGMYTAPYVQLRPKWTQILGYFRVLVVPLFALISSRLLPVSELTHFMATMTMSFSGGLVLSSAMSQIHSNDETVGHLVSLALTIGILTGSCVGSVLDMFL
jgi:hypothetical protein